MSPHQVLLAAGERLDVPHDGRELGRVLAVADGRLELGRAGVVGHGDDDLHVVGGRAALELRLGLDHVLDAGVSVPLDHRFDPNQRLNVGVEAVRHELELSVGRDEGDGAIVVEPRQTHALMELDVLELNGLGLAPAGGLEQNLKKKNQELVRRMLTESSIIVPCR